MPRYISTEAVLNFPVPDSEAVAARVRTLTADGYPVSTIAVANSFGVKRVVLVFASPPLGDDLGLPRRTLRRGKNPE
jgi:hypothetical protein